MPKTLPILVSVVASFSLFCPIFYCSSFCLQLFYSPYLALFYSPVVIYLLIFLDILPRNYLVFLVRWFIPCLKILCYLIFLIIFVFTMHHDCSVSSNSAGFSFFLPSLNIAWSFLIIIHCRTPLCTLQILFYLAHNNILIISNLQSCLNTLTSKPFISSLSLLVLFIKFLAYRLSVDSKMV